MVAVVKIAWAVLKKIGSFLSSKFKKAVEVASKPVQALKDAWAGIKNKTVELKGKVEEGLENLGEGIAETIEVGVSLIQNGWSSVSNWVSGFLGGAVNKAIGLAKNAWDTVSSWVSGFIGGTVNKAIGLAQNAWSSVSAWVSGFMGGAVNKAIGLSKSFGNGIADVAGWLKDKMGGAVNKLIGLEKNGWSNIAGWLGDKMGSAVNKAIGLSTDFGKKVTTVADWVKNRMGGAVNKGIGLAKDFGKGVDSVAEWVKGKIGGAVKKGIGLEKSGWGKKVKTVSDWVKTKLGKGVSVGVSLVRSGWKSLKKWLFGKKGGYITKNGVKAFAGGGLPPEGQVFVAREAGPELVGTLHGRTAVMNNDQIVASVSSGVARALSAVHFRINGATPQVAVRSGGIGSSDDTTTARLIADNREMISLLRQLITEVKAQDTNVYLDGKAISNNTVKHINQDTRRTGKLAIIV
jgi:phage-related protein